MTQEQFMQHGASFVFSDMCEGSIVTTEYRRHSLQERVLKAMKHSSASKESLITTPSAYEGKVEVHQV